MSVHSQTLATITEHSPSQSAGEAGASTSLPQPARIAWIDTCKGIGIILVVVGHLSGQPWIHAFLYIFHMPLFFFLAGYCHKVTSSYKSFFKTKTIHLLVPYLSFLMLYAPVEWLSLRRDGEPHAVEQTLVHLAWGGALLKGALAVFWFVTCLFATQIVMNWLLARFRSLTVAGIAVLSLALSYVNSIYLPHLSLPLDLNVVLAVVPIYYLGYAAKGWNLDSWVLRAVCLGGVAVGVFLVVKHVEIAYDMRDTRYGVPVVTLAVAFAYIVTVIAISKWLSGMRPAACFLGMLGTASMGIMFLHFFIADVLRWGFHVHQAALLCAAALLISFGITMALSRWRVTRALLLGSKKDFLGLVSSGS